MSIIVPAFLRDLEVSSSRLVDIVLEIEDAFDIEVADDEADKIVSIGAAIDLIQNKLKAAYNSSERILPFTEKLRWG